jgi:DNA-binding transcriptional LysR family regulator
MNAEHWNELELLDHLLRGKTLSAAARTLKVDQTTVSRRLAAFERQLGTRLFHRIEGALEPTPELAEVRVRLRLIAEEAEATFAILKRRSAELRGEVRITSVGFVLARILAPALAHFTARNPAITLDLIAEDQSLSFARREADIALRFGSAAEDDARIKLLGPMPFALFRPKAAGNASLPVVRYGEELDHLPEMKALDLTRPGARVALRSSRLDILIEAAVAGGAEIMLPAFLGRNDARFAPVVLAQAQTVRPLYLIVHPERRRVPTVARTVAWVEKTIRTVTSTATPGD